MILLLFTSIVAAAVLAIEIAYNSELAYAIKKLLFIDESRPVLTAMSKFRFYHRLLGSAAYVLSPLVLLAISIVWIYKVAVKLVNCAYCLSYHLSWIFILMTTNVVLPLCFLYALLSIPVVHFVERYILND